MFFNAFMVTQYIWKTADADITVTGLGGLLKMIRGTGSSVLLKEMAVLSMVSPCRGYVALRSSITPVELSYASTETAPGSSDKTPLLILHGLLGSKTNWNSMMKAIHKNTGRKVITADARNHGESPHTKDHGYREMAEDVRLLLKRLGCPQSSILGHSMGGRTAMLVALKNPNLVSNLIVADISPVRTSPNIYSMEDMFSAMSSVTIPPGTPMSKARTLASFQLTNAVPDENVRNFIITNLVQTATQEYDWRINLPLLRSCFKNKIALFTERIRNLQYQGPTLFIAGQMSDYVSQDDLPAIRKYFPKAELVFIEGAGHWVHSQKPAEFLTIVKDFLDVNS